MKIKIVSAEKIRTEKPIEELWLQLRLFESEYYSKQLLKEKYPENTDEELDKLSVIFASNMKQAYEYYSAASNVSILTAPLLYYYGMLCLTNVLWASLHRTEEIESSHGLGRMKTGKENRFLSEEYVKVQEKGDFPALHSCFSDVPIKTGTKFCLKDIFSVIPELETLFIKIYNEKSRAMRLNNYNQFDSIESYSQKVLKDSDFFKQYNVKLGKNLLDEVNFVESPYDFKLLGYPFQKNINGDIFFYFAY